jgi:hypothetical protein
MQDIMFATFVYSAILSFVCCLRYQPNCAVKMATKTANLPKEEPQPASLNQVSTTEPEQKPEPGNALIEQEAGVQGAGCKGERVSLAQKSPAAMPWSEAEQGLQSPSVCPPAPPSPAPLPLFEESLVASDGSYKTAQSEEPVVETVEA